MQSLLATLSTLAVKLEVRDGKLLVSAPAGVLTPELRQAIGRHKEALIERLRGYRSVDREQELPPIVPDPARRHEPFPLNDVQHAYWVGRSGHVELGGVSSHVYFEFECGELEPRRLSAAWRRVVALHDMLRAVVDVDGRQRVLESVPPYEIAVHDLRDAAPERRLAEAERVRAELSHQVLACDRWPLFEIRLLLLGAGRSRLCVSIDFLVVDAWSMSILFRQWHGFYEDPEFQASMPGVSFRDYVLAAARLKALPSYQASRDYWWERLDALPPAPQLPLAKRLETGRGHRFERRQLRLTAARWEAIKARAGRSGLTLASVLLAALVEVLDRWSTSAHFCLNLTVFNRLPLHEEVGEIVGDFTNLMVLEVDARGRATFGELASRLQRQFLSDFEHRRVSAVEVLRELARRRSWQGKAILPVVFTSTLMADGRRGGDAAGWERFGPLGYGICQTPQVLLDHQVFEVNGELVINWDAVEGAFLPGVLDDMFAALRQLLESLAVAPETWDQDGVTALPAAQRRRRREVNDTAAPVADTCLHELFVARALAHPDRIALEHHAGEMTYGELLDHGRRIAERLRRQGASANQLVAVVMVKGWEQVAALLGVLMAGAAYLPIDPRWPALRREQLLSQGRVRLALTQDALDERLEWPADVLRLTVGERGALGGPVPAIGPRQSAEDLAYVIFTSGSTGTPKGVMISHRAAVNTVLHVNRLFGVGEADKVLAVSSLTFDLSVYDVFGLLAAGGSIVMPDPELAQDPGHWRDLVARRQVTLWNSAPPLAGVLTDAVEPGRGEELASLRLVLLSGDWIPVQLPGRLRRLARGARVVSLGGATEGSIWSIYHPIDEIDPAWDSIPYGKPLPNQHMYVLDERLEDCPELVAGDVYIGGLGVALGYWDDPERTRRQFVEHPATGERLYRTGDLGRYHEDGNIEFLGRNDHQVKLRGHRVELGEIAACIQTHPEVRDAVVQLARQEGRTSLTAYVVAAADGGDGSRLFARREVDAERQRQVSGLVAAAAAEQQGLADRAALRTFSAFWQQVESASLRSMLETAHALGLADGSPVAARLDELVAEGRVLPQYRRLVRRWLRVLASGGLLHPAGEEGYEPAAGGGVGGAGTAADEVEPRLAALERAYGRDEGLRGFVEHVAGCLRHQLALLGGQVTPLELLFPEGSWHRAAALYETSPIMRHHNRVVAAIVRALVGAWEGDRLRVLEIGAGTGGTSASVLPELPAARTEYWYTDLSSYFFNAARARFHDYPFVRYAVLDAGKPLQDQGHQPHSYDLVVAANVLHNAADLDACLARIRGLLRPGGYLLLLEGTRTSPWQWATVGYLEVVGGYADERAATDVPILTAEQWPRLLGRSGFPQVRLFPGPDAAVDDPELAELLAAMPQHVIAAQGPGCVGSFRSEELAAFVRERLPDYMIPARWALLEKIPLTANGKLDLAALPSEVSLPAGEERRLVAPGSEVEERLLRIWRDVLGVQQLSIADNFFEVGGDSLLMTEVLRRLNQAQQPPLTIATLFAYPTVRSLAEHLGSGTTGPQRRRRSAVPEPAPDGGRERAGDVAIIGMAGRFPDAAGVDELWRRLAAGSCAVRRFGDDELLRAGVSREDLARDDYVKAGLVLADMELFDASYFGFSPREAEIMDPQQRFLLECAVSALEDAGYPSEQHAARIGVFVGKGTSLYLLEHVLPHTEIVQQLGVMPVFNLNEKDHAATLVSYKLGLTGPSVNVNTACSTSLVAVHAACQSLRAGECEVALAGGVSFVSTLERSGYVCHEGHITSPDGVCRPFADDANGCVFGSGVGLVVLKPLAAALRDRDSIRAVIRGSAINNDGAQKVGYSAPGLHGQVEVIRRAQEQAGVSADQIQLLEAHGTGTHLGDPIEFGALRLVFGGARPDGTRCALGSIKGNIGHLDSAAGIAGMIKVVEALRHRLIPPTLHARVANRKLDLADSPFHLNSEAIEWRAGAGPRRAGVSSFGVGGTNAHVVIEEAPAALEAAAESGCQLLPLAARSRASLERLTCELAEHLGGHPELSLADVAFTLQAGRNAHAYRSFVVCDRLAGARDELARGDRLRVVRQNDTQTAAVAFLFPGQGAQQRGVARELYQAQPGFRAALDECAAIVREYTRQDLRDWLYPDRQGDGGEEGGAAAVDIDQTAFTQPLLFSVAYSLARFWESLGVRPAAMLGHSIGEYVAACLAGVFSLPEALSLIVVRGQLVQSLEPGRMLAVSCAEPQLRELLRGSRCSVAAVNGPAQCVLSGAAGDVEALHARLESAGIAGKMLRTSHAFHSAMVEPILETYEQCVAAVERRPPAVPFVSNVTGTWIGAEEAVSPAYWARHLRQTVRFGDGLRELLRMKSWLLLEVGPGCALSTLAKKAGAAPDRVIPTLGYDGGARGETRSLLDGIGRLWQQGVAIDWPSLHQDRRPRRIPLPAYAFDRQRYWIERRVSLAGTPARVTVAPAPAPPPAAAAGDGAAGDAPAAVHTSHARPELPTAYVAPANEIEARLAEIWQSYLGIGQVGTRDNFFELGGDSLVATRVHAQIKTDLGVELPVGKMFELATIRRIYLYVVASRNPEAIESLGEDELEDLLAAMES